MALDAATGKLKWKIAQGPTGNLIKQGPIVYNGIIYFLHPFKYIVAYNAPDGKELWESYNNKPGVPVFKSDIGLTIYDATSGMQQ